MPALEYVFSFIDWLQANPQLSGVVFLVFFATLIAVGFPGTAILWVSSGMIFGMIGGTIISVLGGTLAALVTHMLVGTTVGRWLDKRAGNARQSVRQFVDSGNAFLLVVPRLIPIFPLFVVNVALAAAGVPRKAYLVSTFFGLIPLAAIFASIGSQLDNARELQGVSMTALIMTPGFLLPLSLFLAVTIVGWLWGRRNLANPDNEQ